MTKEKLKGLIALGSLMGIVGFVLLFFSVNFGTYFAQDWLTKQDGVDTSFYLLRVEEYINSFLSAGSILFGIGLITIIYAYTIIPKIQK